MKKKLDKFCDYDWAYTREDASEIGWCAKCQCNPKCPYNRNKIYKNKNKNK